MGGSQIPPASFLDQDQPSLGSYLNSGLMGEKWSEGRRMARPEFWEGMFLVGIVPGVLHAVSHLIFTTIL